MINLASGGYDGRIRIDTRVDRGGFNAGIRGIEAGIGRVTSSLSKLAGLVGIAFGVTALVSFGKQAIGLSSDLTEVQNVVDTAFQGMSGQVDAWAKNAIKQFGMSELAAKQMSSTYMAINTGMGMSGQGAADMAMKTAERAADISSFYNKSLEESDTMLKSIWTGETESLKQLGVVMTQANLDLYALSNGYGKTVQQMSQAEQVQLRYAYVMDQTRLAAGDFAKTQDSWANQTKVLSEQWKQFLSIMGDGLIQILTPALKFLNQFMGVLIEWAQQFSAIISAIFGKQMGDAAANTEAVAGATGDVSSAQDDLAQSTKKANKELKKQTASFDELNVLQSNSGASGGADSSGSPAGGAAVSVPGFSGEIGDDVTLSPKVQKIFDTIKGMIENLKTAFESVAEFVIAHFWQPIKTAFELLSSQFERFRLILIGVWSDLKTLIQPVIDWFVNDFVPLLVSCIETIGYILAGLFDSFNTVFSDIWHKVVYPILEKFITVVLPTVTQFIHEIVKTAKPLFDYIKKIFDSIWKDVLSPFFEFVTKVWCDLWDIIADLWGKYGEPIFEALRDAINGAKDTFENAWKTIIKPVFDNIFRVLNELWDNHLKPLVAQIGEFIAKLVQGALEIYNKFILPIVNWFVNTLGPPITQVINAIISKVGEIVGRIADAATALFKSLGGVVDFVTGIFTGNWEKAWQGISDVFKGIWDGFVAIAKSPINAVIDMLNGLIDAVNSVIRGLNKIHVDLPGGGSWGISIPTIGNIPRLAQGAVIPPNREFMAILGDQKSGTNIEAPLSTIERAVENALQRSGTAQSQEITLRLVSDRGFARCLKVELDRESQLKGVRLVKGGVMR